MCAKETIFLLNKKIALQQVRGNSLNRWGIYFTIIMRLVSVYTSLPFCLTSIL